MNSAPPFTRPNDLTALRRPTVRRTSIERLSHLATIGFVAMFVVFLVGIAGFAAFGFRYADRVYPGMTIAGADVSGMTRDEVTVAVRARFEDFAGTPLTLTAGEQAFDVSIADLGITLDEDATADRMMAAGRSGSLWERSIAWSRGALDGSTLQPTFAVDDVTFRKAMEDVAPNVIFGPSDARIDVSSTGEATLVADVPGLSLNVSATKENVLDRVGSMIPGAVPLSLVSVPAAVGVVEVEGGLPDAQRALSSAIVLDSDDGKWGLSRSTLSELVWVDDSGTMQLRREGVEAYVQTLASQIDRPAENAGITVDEAGAFVVVPQVDAATVDIDGTVDRLVSAIDRGETSVEIEVGRSQPAILDETAEEWAERAETLVGDGVELTWSGGSSQLGRADLIAALVIESRADSDEQFALSFDETVIAERLTPLQEDLYIEREDAQFRLVDDQVKFQSEAKQGREVDMDGSVNAVLDAVTDGEPQAALVMTMLEPTYTAADRSAISLPNVLGQSQTYYGNSSDPRRNNVERATEIEDGWLIPPDGVFSYAEFMGLVDEANGFVTGYGIVADPEGGVTTAPVIGGGICQVSTTIYQAAFWAGLPIVERWAHPYWLEGYGQAPYGMQGLDAMVNIEPDWALDLKFENNTGNWIALVMVADGENVHAEIRGTDPGWVVDVAEPVVTDVVKPSETMIYTDSPELPRGEELQVEHAREGFTSTITRTVRDGDGNVIDEYVLESTYAASRDTTLRGTGQE
ncbi:MAG: VanW family protein [Chloroflexia bacterium]|nr:VanW family protein [Chloroflexia bacterium]